MAIPSVITDLSTTAANNSPAGSETIGNTLDDYLRAYQAIIRTEYDKTVPTLPPAGRLTLTTAVPVTTSDVTGATTVYYTPYHSDTIVLYDGTNWAQHTFTELSQATTDNTKSPAAVANNSNYDMFVWNDSGTLRCTRGPAWTSDTARGTGAGTTELELFEGRYVNKAAITNGPAARRGLYVGTIRSDGSAQINDSAALRHVWNNYNRVKRTMAVTDATDSWTYSTSSWRQARASAANQLDYVAGLADDAVKAEVVAQASNSTSTERLGIVAVGVDSTTVPSGLRGTFTFAANTKSFTASYRGNPGLGRHTLVWLEFGGGTDTQTWYGDAGGTNAQSGINGEVMA